MSSSTSTSKHPPQAGPEPVTAQDRRAFCFFAGALVCLLGGIAALNAWRDPYAYFVGKAPIIVHSGSRANLPLTSLLELRRIPPDVYAQAEIACAGDSRGQQLTPERSMLVEGHPVLNFSCGGATLEESLLLLAEHQSNLPQLQTLIICTPLERFTNAAQQNRLLETKPLASSPLRYLLNGQITRDSFTLLTQPKESPQKKTGTPRNARGVTQAGDNPQVLRSGARMFKAYNPATAEARMAALQATVAPFRTRGVRVIFWRPPVNADVQRLIVEHNLQPVWEQMLLELRKMADVVDLTYDAEINGQPYRFIDPVHTKDAPQILLKLLQESRDSAGAH